MEISRLGHSCHAVTASESHSEPQSYGKRHEKALGKAWKSGAEGESLKLLKESGAIFSLRTLFHLRLPCHCNEGKQEGDDGLLVHFVLSYNFSSVLDEDAMLWPFYLSALEVVGRGGRRV